MSPSFVSRPTSRRTFLKGVGCTSAVAAWGGARLGRLSFAQTPGAAGDTLVVVFLRGGWDALNAVPVIDGPDRGLYEQARGGIKVPTQGEGAAVRLDERFGLHAGLAPLADLYQAGHLAVVHATGLTTPTRSHFDAMEFIDLGTPGSKTTASGWIARHLESVPGGIGAELLPAVGVGSQPESLLGLARAASLDSLEGFNLWGNGGLVGAQRKALERMYAGEDWLSQAGSGTLQAIAAVEATNPGAYQPANGARYEEGSWTFSGQLRTVAQMIKLGLGLRAATIDLGGWDTHEYQGDDGGGYFFDLTRSLADGLVAFYTDLAGSGDADHAARTTVVVVSEFGRRLVQNAAGGTDHGHGSAMLVLGGNVAGGKVYGRWPGLLNEQLFERTDLAVTTDYRQVLGEILVRRLGNPYLDHVFPGFGAWSPLGIVRGAGEPQAPPATATARPVTPVTPAPTAGATARPTDAPPRATVPAGAHRIYLPAGYKGVTPSGRTP